MKYVIILLSVLVLLAGCVTPPEDLARATITDTQDTSEQIEGISQAVPIDFEKSTFEFEGYTPVKSHVGSFSIISGTLDIVDGTIVGGSGTIGPSVG